MLMNGNIAQKIVRICVIFRVILKVHCLLKKLNVGAQSCYTDKILFPGIHTFDSEQNKFQLSGKKIFTTKRFFV